MSGILVRLSLLLFVLSFAGLAGLSSSVNPIRIRTAYAASVEIQIKSNGGADIDFTIGSAGCPNVLVPGESCIASITVFNTGTDPVRLSAPAVTESGALETCTGNDPDNPGGGGNNLSTQLSNLSYVPSSTVLGANQTATFNLTVGLSTNATNACQAKTGLIVVEIVATGPDDVIPTPTPVPQLGTAPQSFSSFNVQTTANVNVAPQAPAPAAQPQQPVSEVQGVRTDNTPPLVSEVLPARLPVTGQGFISTSTEGVARLVFLGMAMLGAGLLLSALLVARRMKAGR